VNEETFLRLNQPAPGLQIKDIIQGLERLRKEMPGEMWLEIMLVGGINNSPEDLEALSQAVAQIRPHRIQLNTVVRPPAYPEAKALSLKELKEIATRFFPEAEIIFYQKTPEEKYRKVSQEEILTLLKHRPCPSEEIASALGFDYKETLLALQRMVQQGQIKTRVHQKKVFYYV